MKIYIKSKYILLSILVLTLTVSAFLFGYKYKASSVKTESTNNIKEMPLEKENLDKQSLNKEILRSDFEKLSNIYKGTESYVIVVKKDKDLFKITSKNKLCRYEIELPTAISINENTDTNNLVKNLNKNINTIFIPSAEQMENCEAEFIKAENINNSKENDTKQILIKENRYLTYIYNVTVGHYNANILSLLVEGLIIPTKNGEMVAAHPTKFTQVYNIKPDKEYKDSKYTLDELFAQKDLKILSDRVVQIAKYEDTDGYKDIILRALESPSNIFLTSDKNIQIVNIFDSFVLHNYHIKVPYWSIMEKNPDPIN